MPFDYVNTHGSYFVNVGLAVGFLTDPQLVSISIYWPYVEPVVRAISHTYWGVGWMPVEDTLGIFRDHGLPTADKVLGTKPQNYDYSSSSDYSRYGSNLDSIRKLAGMLRGESISFLPGREHSVLHASYRGDIGPSLQDTLIPGYVDPDWVEYIYSTYGNTTSRPCFLDNSHGNSSQDLRAVNNIGGIDFSLYEYLPDWGYRTDLIVALDSLKSAVAFNGLLHFGVFPWGDVYFTSISSLDYEVVNPNKIVVTFQSTWSEYAHSVLWKWDCRLTIERSVIVPPNTNRLTFVNDVWSGPIQISGSPSFTLESTLVDGTLVFLFDPSVQIGMTFNYVGHPSYGWIYQSRPVRGDGTGTVDPDFTTFARRNIIQSFADKVQERAADIRASSFLSASDALDSLSGQIDTNLVEATAEADEFISILPELKASIETIISLPGGNVIETVQGLLDFVTSLRLQQRFAWDPDFDLILNTLPKMQKVADRIARLRNSGVVAGRGTFRYQFPSGEFGRENASLITHSKVICKRDPKSLLEDVLGVRSLGILPDASHSWAVIPFSFVVDWFINLGGRLHDLENIGFLLLMSVQVYTHSYLITSPLMDSELARDGLRPSNISSVSVFPELRFFAREVSAYVPRVYDGRYDFEMPGRPPNWMTAGSLAWQLLSPR